MKKYITIVDYGLGNIRSAEQSLKKVVKENNIDADVMITNNAKDIYLASHIILPGQGAFETCMKGLENIEGMIDALSQNVLIRKKPFLGICVGMQLLATKSYENGTHHGLGWIDGEIKKIPSADLKLPHMGWNEVLIKKHLEVNDLVFHTEMSGSPFFILKDGRSAGKSEIEEVAVLATSAYTRR